MIRTVTHFDEKSITCEFCLSYLMECLFGTNAGSTKTRACWWKTQ